MRLGTWLLSKGKLTEDQLQRSLQHQSFFGGRLGSSLIKLGFIDEDILGAYLSDVSGSPYAPPSLLESVPPDVIATVPGRLAAQYRVVPLAIEGRRLRLAMRDPKDLIALDEIAFLTGLSIDPYVATEFRIQRALQRYYQMTSGTPTLPVANAAAEPPSPAAPAISSRPGPAPGGASPASSSGHEVGLDGYPLDADSDAIANSITGRTPAVPSAGGEADPQPPTSLEQWRLAQEEIPDEIPEPPPAVPIMSPGRGGTAAAASLPQAAPHPARVTAPVPVLASLVGMAPAGGTAGPSLEATAIRLRQAETRDEIFNAILDFSAARFLRSALFIVQADRVLGWGGRGGDIDPARVRQIVVPLDRPSLFGFFKSGADYYHGPVAELPANTRFFLDLGCTPPARALLLPLLIKERPTVVLYADSGAEPSAQADIAMLRRLLGKAALALEVLILKNKITSL